MSKTESERRRLPRTSARAFLLVGVSLVALATSNASVFARPLGSGTATRSPSAAAAAAAAAQNRQNQQAAQQTRNTLSRVTRAVQSMRDVQERAREAARLRPSAVPNGLGKGGLNPAVKAPRPADLDPTGMETWDGANMPTEVIKDGLHTVTVEQTDSRAILSWKTFNIGKDTTLVFDQDGNKDWVVLNRVVGGLDENGRRTAALDPTKILGSIKADGTVLIMNQNGVIFGAGAQIRTNSLVATTAEIGRGFRFIGAPDPTNRQNNEFEALTLVERNAEFKQYGLLGVRDSLKTDIERDLHSEFMPYFDDVVLANGRRDVAREDDAPKGGIFVQAGAEIELGEGGFALLNSTRVENAGRIVAPEANVSLVAAWGASLITSNGTSANGDNPYYRGVMGFDPTGRITPGFDGSLTYTDADGVRHTVNDDLGEVYSRNTGIIEAPRGAIRLIENAGVLLSTTSVSRNGYIAIDRAMPGSVTSILADTDPETIPLDRDSIANFKASRIEIGYYVGADALVVAPGGDVAFGPPVDVSQNGRDIEGGQRVLVESGAIIDVAGLTDVLVPASRNAIQIGPLKGNELADSPEFRDSFLNGALIYVDPRKSGVREDGVAWIGSPLVDAASYYAQVGVTSSELLTKGGSVTFATLRNSGDTLGGTTVSDTIVERGAIIDISGGSVRYEGGPVRSTSLLGADGRIYDISQADPLKMTFVGFGAGFTRFHNAWGVARSYVSPLRPGARMEREYTEGRDAGTLDLPGDVVVFEGSVKAGVIIGDRQRADAREGTGSSDLDWDQRLVQGSGSELPVAGAIRIGGDLSGGSEVRIVAGDDMPALDGPIGYGRDFGVIDATFPTTETGEAHGPLGPRDEGSALSEDRIGTTYISADMLNEAGFGQIEIARGGDITIEKKASVTLADGGLFTAASGGSIRVDGSITAASGVVALETAGNDALQVNFDLPRKGYSPYDIVVNGTISVRGKWVNDFQAPGGIEEGGAHLDGGTIVLFAGQAAANTTEFDQTQIRDISGSVLVNAGATLDVSGGGRIDRDGDIDVSARGGNLALISEVNYFSGATEFPGVFVRSQHVEGAQPIVPDAIIAKVAIDSGATILSHGFAGGGTFQLVTPEFSFGEKTAKVGTALSMDFISEQGFQNYDITSYKTKIVESKFRDDFDPSFVRGYDAFLDTQTITIKAGETLQLRNSVFSLLASDRSLGDIANLRTLESGGDLYSVLTPTSLDDMDGRDNAFYRQPVNLSFGGSIELKVAKGGKLIGEAGATLTTPRLINEGLIRLPGGNIVQRATLPQPIAGEGRAVRDPYEGLVAREDGTYRETDLSNVTTADGRRLTNGEAYVGYLLGELASDVGVELRAGSVTDLGGVSLRDPLAHAGAGQSLADGRILSGGSITMAPEADRARGFQLFPDVDYSRFAGNGYKDDTNFKKVLGLKFVAQEGSRLDISGAKDVYERPSLGSSLKPGPLIATNVWSDAGGIYASNGATLTGAQIDAHGGAAQARGGVLEIGDLVLTQNDTETPLANTVSADMITRSGFDLLHARGSVDTIGDVDLTLGRAFFLTSREIVDQTGVGAIRDPRLYANVGTGGALSISADYVRLEGYSQTVDAAPQATGTGSVTFSAGQIDVVGGVRFDESVGSATLDATGDVRLVGQSDINRRLPADALGTTVLSDEIGMHLAAGGDLTIRASRVYPVTGTTALVTSSGAASTIRFERAPGSDPTTPYSAGADVRIQAAHIQQNGALFVPHGSLTLGSNETVRGSGSNVLAPVTETVTLGDGSLTSVSGGEIRIPYGVTTDLTEYYFAPGGDDALEQTPEKRLTLGGGEVVMEDGAKIDVSGGGDLFAYEFIPGTGGSRDVLDRLNVDDFSSNDGLTYPDGRQVYAIVPGLSDEAVAAFDPYFSSGYDALGRPTMAGTRVYLEAGNGLKAGWYTLLPAKYAVLPGGLRIVEQPGGPGLYSTGSAKLADGTIRVSGRYGQFGSSDWRWRRFDVQTQSTFLGYSNIALTSAQATFANRAAEAGEAAPRLPLDAGSLTFDARTKLSIDGVVDSTPGKGGRGVTVDVGGSAIYVVSDPTAITLRDGTVLADGAVVREINGQMVLCADAASTCAAGSKERLSDVAPLLIAADDLTGLGAESLLIGGTRAQQSDGTTEIRTTAYRLVVANDETSALAAPEILLAVGLGQNELVDATGQPVDPDDSAARVTRDVRNGPAKALIIAEGAVIEARGEVRDQSTADYVAAGGWVGRTFSATDPGSGFRRSTAGAFLRVANGPERIIRRDDLDLDAPETATNRADLIAQYERRYGVDLSVGSGARLSGTSVLADVGTYLNPTLSTGETGLAWTPKATLSIDAASIRARTLTLGAGEIALTDGTVDRGVLAVSHDFLDGLRGGGASRLNLLSRDVIGIDGGTWSFGELALTTPGLESRDGGDVTIEATRVDFGNVADTAAACADCGGASLSIRADEIVFGEGQVAANGFGGGVSLTATQGLFAHGEGGLDVGASALTIDAPVIADRAAPQADDTLTTVVPTEMTLRSAAAVRILNTSTAELKAFERTPGAILRVEGESLSVEGTRISASAGMIDLKATGGDVTLASGALIEAPGYEKAFGDVVRSAPAGSVRLQSDAGDVVIGANARVTVGGAVGKAGALALVAQEGDVVIRGEIDGAAKEGDASILVDTGGSFDLDAFAALAAARNFDGRVAVFSGAGDLTLGAGTSIRAASLTLGADGGAVDIFGRIDTSGVNGGDVSLFGQTGVRLRDGSLIDTGATGYAENDSRRAKSGSVTIAVGANGKITLDQGSTIDVAADRGEGRLVPVRREGETYYYYVAADQGGSVNLRAPVIEGEGGDRVDVVANGRVLGAHEVVLEAYKTWDLDTIADSGNFTGVSRDENGNIVLDVREGLDTVTYDSRTGRTTIVDAGSGVNLLGDTGEGTVASYIQGFDVSASLAALGDLATGGNFHARPGVELTSKGDVTFASNWNLAAGVVDIDAALADGVMYVPASVGKAAVMFGREADLVSDYTAMTYRVGGSALGEAGAISIRAGGDLTVAGTITDGFFQFRNQTDDAFLPKAMAGQRPETAPYSAEANSAAAIGKDAAGSMELFPLIDGEAMGSFSLNFAAGADLDSADGSRTVASSDSDFSVVGLNSYVATSAASRPTSRTAYYRNLIRTGVGSIEVAAAGSIDLRGEEDPIFVRTTDDRLVTDRKSFGDPRQIGGAAIYSAGRRVNFEPIIVTDAQGRRITLDTTSLLPTTDPLRSGLSTFTYAATSAIVRASGPAGVLVGDLAFSEGGGDVTLTAGLDVLGRRDLARSSIPEGSRPENARYKTWMSDYEPWRQGQVGQNAAIRINAAGFYDGVGALAGGDVTVTAGRDVSDLNMVSTTSLASAATSGGRGDSKALMTFGSGDVFVSAGRDILGGRVDVASGEGLVTAARSIASAGDISSNVFSRIENTLRLRLSDAEISVSAGQGVDMQGIAALGAYSTQDQNSLGFYTARAGVSIDANADVLLRNDRDVAFAGLSIWPGSFHALTTGGDLELRRTDLVPTEPGGDTQILMAPSPIGQLELLAAGDIAPATLAMSDADPGLLPGLFGSSTVADFVIEPEFRTAEVFAFPNLRPDATESEQRRQHSETPLHGDDDRAALVSAGRDISGVILSTPKETRVSAGRDILDMVFFGQNLDVSDVTRIVAGRDIIASSSLVGAVGLQSNGQIDLPRDPRATLQGNVFVIGGPGSFYLEAGRNAGPFLTSANVTPFVDDPNSNDPAVLTEGPQVSFGGGVLSVGDEYNPWLAAEGADVTVMFGVGKGVAWNSFRDAYLDPANFGALDSALFTGGDRSRPVYGPKLIEWLKDNAPREFEAATGSDTPDYASAYAIFKGLSDLRQRGFISEVYFAELAATSDPNGVSFQQYQRGYRAVNTLFPEDLGYTVNDLTGGSNGANEQIRTGDLDLRLATIQTSRGGDIRLFGPGGRVLAGSVVRTAQQIARRNYNGASLFEALKVGAQPTLAIDAIPSGYEGLLTVRGGSISTFTDGDVLLNQSRLFTQGGGDIIMWSSNGDLNGGEGPKTSSNFPPVVVNTDYNGFSIEDRRGSATGAGIAAFQPSTDADAPDIYLIAPRGTVDAGAAGIRVAGNINVAAQTVANADNIAVGVTSVGAPSLAAAPIGGLTTNAGNEQANQASASNENAASDQASIIIVEVLGYGGGEGQDCPPDQPDCKAQPQ